MDNTESEHLKRPTIICPCKKGIKAKIHDVREAQCWACLIAKGKQQSKM
jgi:hypothetical protein